MAKKRKTVNRQGRNSFSVHQGDFVPMKPMKYRGDINKIRYRSKLELRMMKALDHYDRVLEWNSEEVVVPYTFISPLRSDSNPRTGHPSGYYENQKHGHMAHCDHDTFLKFKKDEGKHDYNVDFWVKVKAYDHITDTDKIVEWLIEVKCEEDTRHPTLPRAGSRKRYWEKLFTYHKNGYKWSAAEKYARKNHQIFIVITEKILNKFLDAL